jgi:hypothetical protein
MRKTKIPYTKRNDGIIGYAESELARSETNDCVVRAIASSSNMAYDKAHKWVADNFNRKNREGTYLFHTCMNIVNQRNMRINRRKVHIIDREQLRTNGGKSKMTVGTFVKNNTKGSFIIQVSGHAFTVKDGNIIGNLDDAIKTRRVILGAWRIGSK